MGNQYDTAVAHDIQGVPNGMVGAAYRHIAIVWVAMFEAANAIHGKYRLLRAFAGRRKERLERQPSRPQLTTHSASFSAPRVTPNQSADLDAKYAASLADIPDGQSKDDGIAVGEAAAQGIIALRASDHSSDVVPYTAPPDVGGPRPSLLPSRPR